MPHWNQIQSNIEQVTFGVEFETLIPAGSAVRVGNYHAGSPVTVAPTFLGQFWRAERDSSIHGRSGQPCEFVSPVLKGEAGVAHLLEFLAWLNSIGARVNTSCGFHIHVGIAGYVETLTSEAEADFIHKLARVASFYSTALYAQTGTLSRETGCFCAKPGQQFRQAVKAAKAHNETVRLASVGRYQMLNLTNVARNHTVEFRCFAGTLNPNKVLVHLFSVLGICRVAADLASVPAWEDKGLSGKQSVWNLLKVRPMRRLVACKSFGKCWSKMVAIALEMAIRYDNAKNPQPAAAPAVAAVTQ